MTEVLLAKSECVEHFQNHFCTEMHPWEHLEIFRVGFRQLSSKITSFIAFFYVKKSVYDAAITCLIDKMI